MRMVVAVGGNALLGEEETFTWQGLLKNVSFACKDLSEVIHHGHQLVLTHGNGPQIGLLAEMLELVVPDQQFSFDVLSSVCQGAIGYAFLQAMHKYVPARQVSCLLTQVEVDPDDPSLRYPDKSIGPLYSKEDPVISSKETNWILKQEGKYYRRVVPSPKPIHIVEIDTIKKLLDKRIIVIAGGSGGMPIAKINGQYQGVDAVIDKDLTSALIAEKLDADFLLIATAIDAVYENWNTPQFRAIKYAHPDCLMALDFKSHAIAIKIKACCDFVKRTKKQAAIGALKNIKSILNKQSGTVISTDYNDIVYY